NLVHKSRDRGFECRIGFLVLHVEDDLLVQFDAASFLAQLLDRFGAQPKMLLDDRVNGAGGGQHDFEALAQQQAQVPLLHLARRLAKSQQQPVILDAQRQQVKWKTNLSGTSSSVSRFGSSATGSTNSRWLAAASARQVS